MKISIVIPAYNEEKRIGKTLKEYSEYFTKFYLENKVDYQILVVINGTKDKTEDVVKVYQKNNKKINYLNLRVGGKGLAITDGFKKSLDEDYDLIGFVDADLATPPKEFKQLIEEIKNCHGVIADRYAKGSNITPKHSFRRILVSRVYNFIVRVLFSVRYRDTQCGAKLFRKEVIREIFDELALTNWAFDVNILYLSKKKGFYIKSIPTNWFEIEGGNLDIFRTSIQMFFALSQLRLLNSPFRKLLKLISPLVDFTYRNIR